MEGCNERHARGGASSLTLRPSMKISYVSNRTSCSVDTTLSCGLGWARHFRRGWTLTYSARADQLIPSPEHAYYIIKSWWGEAPNFPKNGAGRSSRLAPIFSRTIYLRSYRFQMPDNPFRISAIINNRIYAHNALFNLIIN